MSYTIEAAQDGCYPGTTVLVNKFDLHTQKELNAGYISGWPGYDPENSDANTPRVIYFGINLTL